MKIRIALCSAISLLSAPAMADPYTYSPKGCEFQITFPEKPFVETKCSAGGKDCVEVATYTKTIGADASTNFRVSCTMIAPSDMSKYTPNILEATLKEMSKAAGLELYDTHSSDKDGYNTASSLSISERDDKPLVYNGQLWAGKKSLFTMEAEMIGGQSDEIDNTFVEILRSAYPKDMPPKAKTSKDTASQDNKKKGQ